MYGHYDVIVKMFMFAILSPDEFLYIRWFHLLSYRYSEVHP